MINVVRKEECCGCNACGDICPQNAITFSSDEEGFWYPQINNNKCVNCNLCNKVCPIENYGCQNNTNYTNPSCYAANHKNLQVRFDSTSGGVFSALANYFFENGGYVGGAVFTEEWSVRQIVTNRRKDITRLRSSKYLQSNAEGYYKKIKEKLEAGEKVLAVGLPCQIAALRLFLKKEYDNLLLVDLICLYINSPLAYRKYLEDLEEQYNSRIVYLKPKNKELGWKNLTQKAIFENGRSYYGTIRSDPFLKAGMGLKCISRPSCYECRFKEFPRFADITIGDYWNNDKELQLDDNTGTSVIIINSHKGKSYVNKITNSLKLADVSLEGVVRNNPALVGPLDKPVINRKAFFARIQEESFSKVVDSFCASTLSYKRKIAAIFRVVRRQIKYSRLHIKANLQFLHINFFHPAVRSSVLEEHIIYVNPGVIFNIKRGARLELNGFLVIGESINEKSNRMTKISMKSDTRLTIGNAVTGGCNIGNGSEVEILNGGHVHIEGGLHTKENIFITCKNKIYIGQMAYLGRNVMIKDHNNGHLINIDGYEDCKPIKIGEHIWLSDDCCINPGVSIGDGSIIKEKCVVEALVPSHVIISGNPARIVAEGIEWKI